MLLKRIFSDNFMLKVIALGLAVLSWFAVNQITSHEKNFESVPLEVLVGESWSVRKLNPDSFEVAFRGSREDIAELDPASVKIVVDLRETKEDEVHRIDLTSKNVLFPGAAYPSVITPSSVYIQLDRIGEKEVTVTPNVTGELSPGFRLEHAKASPGTVKLIGSRRRLEEINAVQTTPIKLDGRIKSFSQSASILAPSEEWGVQTVPSRVDVSVLLVGEETERVFSNVVVQVMNSATAETSRADLTPAVVSVNVKGRDTLIKSLTAEQLIAFVQVPETGMAEERSLPVRVTAPPGVQVLKITPAKLSAITPVNSVEPEEKPEDSTPEPPVDAP